MSKDQWAESEAVREALIDEANRASREAMDQNDRPRLRLEDKVRYTWDEWQRFNAGLDPQDEDTVEPFVTEIGFLKPDLFKWTDYTYINLNQVTRVEMLFGALHVTLADGVTIQTDNEATIERFWEQWQQWQLT